MKCLKITIPYTPKAKASVRTGKYGHYNPSQKGMKLTTDYVKNNLPEQTEPLKGPLLVIVHYKIPAPLGLSGKRRKLQRYLPHLKKPDGDNLEKFLNDALSGVIWADDAQIVWLLRSKSLTDEKIGCTEIFVRELGHTEPNYEQIIDDIKQHISLGD